MLREIPNPFAPLVVRGHRPSRPASETGHRTIPVRVPRDRDGEWGPPTSPEKRGVERIIAEPGPGEVVPPRWWGSR
jgi:hypothetical protein